jgi:hypothetical protein
MSEDSYGKGGSSIIRRVLCCLNVVFVSTGILIFIAGIWFALHARSFCNFISWTGIDERVSEFKQIAKPPVLKQASISFMIFGAIFSTISFMGCYGSCYRNRKFLVFYGVFLAIILLLEIAAAIAIAAFSNDVEVNVKSYLKSSIKNYYVAPEKNAVTVLWDYSMAGLQCCGVDGHEDFKQSKEFSKSGKTVPEACCVLQGDTGKLQPKDSSCPQSPSDSNSYMKKGCYKALTDKLWKSKILTIAIVVILIMFKVLGIFCTFRLWRSISRNERYY